MRDSKLTSASGLKGNRFPEGKNNLYEQAKEFRGPRYMEVAKTIDRMERKNGSAPKVDELSEELTALFGVEFTTEDTEEQIEYLKKTPANHKIVKKSFLSGRLSLTSYGREVLEQQS